MDVLIHEAMQVPVPAAPAAFAAGSASAGRADRSTDRAAARLRWPARQRWLALAASVLGGVAIGSLLWVSAPRAALARDLVEHVLHERDALVATAAGADAASLNGVLTRAGIRLRPGIGTVSYAHSCPFRGRTVPHLVVQTAEGPVAVMILRDVSVARPRRFVEDGFTGSIVPTKHGSIAIVGAGRIDLADVERRITEAVEWLPG